MGKGLTNPDIIQAKNIASYFKISLDDLTNHKLEITCTKRNILSNLIGKRCYIDMLSDDYNEVYQEVCTIIDVGDEFIKFSFRKKNNVIEKLIDIDLITSFQVIEQGEEK